jgi:hypothetical protein
MIQSSSESLYRPSDTSSTSDLFPGVCFLRFASFSLSSSPPLPRLSRPPRGFPAYQRQIWSYAVPGSVKAPCTLRTQKNRLRFFASLDSAGSRGLEPWIWLPAPLSAVEYRMSPVVKAFHCHARGRAKHTVNSWQNSPRSRSILSALFGWLSASRPILDHVAGG